MMPESTLLLYVKLLFLIGVANGAPVLGQTVLRERWNYPLDGGRRFVDGYPLLGPSKTVRGIVLALLATPAIALLLGFDIWTGLIIAAFAMLGDITSSFAKRRMKMASSSQALGIDQIPESLYPLLAVRAQFALSGVEIALLVLAFLVLELAISRVLYRFKLRDQPY